MTSHKHFEDAVGVCAAFERLSGAERGLLEQGATALRCDMALWPPIDVCGGADKLLSGAAAAVNQPDSDSMDVFS